MSNFNWVDYVILAILLLSVVSGFRRGLVREIISIATLIAAGVIATMFASTLAASMTSTATVQTAVGDAPMLVAGGANAAQAVSYGAIGISFGVLFIGTVIIGAIIGFFVNMVFAAGILGIGNRILGAGFGLVRGLILNTVLIFVLSLTMLANQPWWQQSQIIPQYQPAVDWLAKTVSPSLANFQEKASEAMKSVGDKMQNVTQ